MHAHQLPNYKRGFSERKKMNHWTNPVSFGPKVLEIIIPQSCFQILSRVNSYSCVNIYRTMGSYQNILPPKKKPKKKPFMCLHLLPFQKHNKKCPCSQLSRLFIRGRKTHYNTIKLGNWTFDKSQRISSSQRWKTCKWNKMAHTKGNSDFVQNMLSSYKMHSKYKSENDAAFIVFFSS